MSNKINYRRKSMSAQILGSKGREMDHVFSLEANEQDISDFRGTDIIDDTPNEQINLDQHDDQKEEHRTPSKDNRMYLNNYNTSNRQSVQIHILSPSSSQESGKSSRSSLSSPVQVCISPGRTLCPIRRSRNYEISRIQEKRIEDEKNAISYAKRVILSQQQKNRMRGCKSSEKQAESALRDSLSILKRKPNQPLSFDEPQHNCENTNTNDDFLTKLEEAAEAKGKRGRKSCDNWLGKTIIQADEIALLDRKTLQKITKNNTEQNSVIQPERSMAAHHQRLPRCVEHSKRVKELYCIDTSCKVKHKLGCVLCFSSTMGAEHGFHSYELIANEDELNGIISRNRNQFESFIQETVRDKSKSLIDSFQNTYSGLLLSSLLQCASTFPERVFLGFDEEIFGKTNKESDDESLVTKEDLIENYLSSVIESASKRIEEQTKIWIRQSYLGTKDAIFEKEKRNKLLEVGKCFSLLSNRTLELYLRDSDVVYDCEHLENNNPQLHYISDQISEGVYQIEGEGVRSGRGIQFFKSGSIYEGYFKNNQKHGKGKFISFDGELYIGEFKKNMKNGKGTLLYPNNDIYTGDFSQDQCHGQGEKFYANQSHVYIGNWSRNQRHGKGTIKKDSTIINSGIYVNDHLTTPQKHP